MRIKQDKLCETFSPPRLSQAHMVLLCELENAPPPGVVGGTQLGEQMMPLCELDKGTPSGQRQWLRCAPPHQLSAAVQ